MDWKCLFIGAAYIGISGTYSFLLKCPENRAKVLRPGYVCEKPSEYHCLINSSSRQYVETCKSRSWMDEGTYAVLNNLQMHFEPCIHKEFQPFILFSNETYKCLYNKGLCTETGQVIFSNGTASTNRYCQCDYRKGFSFVIKPKQNCYCDQSREDCTCVIVDCENDKQLNSDYVCQNILEVNQTKQMCPEIRQMERELSFNSEAKDNKVLDTNNLENKSVWNLTARIVTIFGIVLVAVCILGIINTTLSGKIDEACQYLCRACYTRHQRSAIVTESNDVVEHTEDTSPVATQMIEKTKDIVVLGMKKEVSDFITELENMSENFTRLACFFVNDENTQLYNLLATYQFIFILYTENFDMTNAGFSEEDINRIRRGDHPKIKIICNCERHLVTDRIDLDFKNYSWDDFLAPKSKYREILEKLREYKLKKKEKKNIRKSRAQTLNIFI